MHIFNFELQLLLLVEPVGVIATEKICIYINSKHSMAIHVMIVLE